MTALREPWNYESPACAEVGTILFFAPDKDDPMGKIEKEFYRYARQVCATCPHKAECAEWGLENEEYGVWGGLTPLQRRALRSERRGPPIRQPRIPLPLRVKR
jgi:WhiB family redox-sensing transcriptional regulator